MWIGESVLEAAPGAASRKRGRPHGYSDATIRMLPGIKQGHRLRLRARQGFAHSLRKLAFVDLPVPSYTPLRRRVQQRNVAGSKRRYPRSFPFTPSVSRMSRGTLLNPLDRLQLIDSK
jgi:hypothetical protein